MIEQGTDAWMQERCGKATASRIADIMAKTKAGYSSSRANYAAQLIAERLTGCVAPGFTNAAMQHGTLTEPEARRAYEFFVDRDVQQVGFVPHPSICMAGASPDGLVGDDGLLELKCPNTATHIETLLTGAMRPQGARLSGAERRAVAGAERPVVDPAQAEHVGPVAAGRRRGCLDRTSAPARRSRLRRRRSRPRAGATIPLLAASFRSACFARPRKRV